MLISAFVSYRMQVRYWCAIIFRPSVNSECRYK